MVSNNTLDKDIAFKYLLVIMNLHKSFQALSLVAVAIFLGLTIFVDNVSAQVVTIQVDPKALGFVIPGLGDIITFLIRFFFALAGLTALIYLLLGAFSWITSGGNKEGVEKAREKIQAAVIGVILIVIVLSIMWTLEQVVFAKQICFGISCPLTLPSLIKPL